jgi:hypothetical protein
MALYMRLTNQAMENKKEPETKESTENKMKANLKHWIQKEMIDYRLQCQNMCWVQWLDDYGNDLYINSKATNKINYSRIRLLKDPLRNGGG